MSAPVGEVEDEWNDGQKTLTREHRQLLAVRELGRVFAGNYELDHLLPRLLDKVTAILDAERATMFLVEGDHLVSKIAEGGEIAQIRVRIGEGIVGATASTGNPINLPDAYADARFNAAFDKASGFRTRSILCMPLDDHDGRVIGVIEVLNKINGTFNEDDEAVLATVAAHAAINIENSRLYEERLRSTRLASLGQLLSSVFHDLRTPLTVIAGYTELMSFTDDQRERTQHAEIILKQIELCSAMTREVLAFARGESNMLLRKVYIERFLEDLREQLEREFKGRGVRVVVNAAYRGVAHFDELKLVRVAHNLARNAAEAMDGDGTFTVTAEADGANLILRFSDTGRGIPDSMKGRLFEAFATADKVGGTGLGLAMVKKIIDEHQGTITYESEPGAGTTFIVTLPLAKASDPTP